MPTLAELRQFAATPQCRYEERASALGRARAVAYALAAFLDLTAAWMLAGVTGSLADPDPAWAPFGKYAAIGWAALILAVLAILPMVWSIGLSASAIAGERENGTLEALLLTPLDRRTLLWAKLIGRTAPPRRFMLATLPAYLCSVATVAVALCAEGFRRAEAGGWFWAALLLFLLAAGLSVTLAWGVLFYQMHAVAAVGLWFSSKHRRTWTASLMTYLAVLGPTVLLMGFGSLLSLAWPMVLGPALFDELVKLFDRRALGPEGLD